MRIYYIYLFMKSVKRKGRKGRGRKKSVKRGGGDETKIYPGVGTYIGELVDGKRQGKGTMTYDDNDVYEGTWWNDARRGDGKITYMDGGVYEGWVEDSIYETGRSGRG